MALIDTWQEKLTGYSGSICSIWTFNSDNVSPYQWKLFHFIDFSDKFFSLPGELAPLDQFPQTRALWMRRKETLFQKLFSYNLRPAANTKCSTKTLLMVMWMKASFYAYANQSFWMWSYEPPVLVTLFPYFVKINKHHSLHTFCRFFLHCQPSCYDPYYYFKSIRKTP